MQNLFRVGFKAREVQVRVVFRGFLCGPCVLFQLCRSTC